MPPQIATAVFVVVVLILSLFLIALPVRWAAAAVGARKAGYLRCLFALLVASLLYSLGALAPTVGALIGFLLSAAGFAAILGTTYMKGIVIAVLHVVFGVLLAVGAALLAAALGLAIGI